MRSFLIVISAFTLLVISKVGAQTGGFKGKHLNLKLDLLEGKYAAFSGIHMEYIFFRQFSVTAGYKSYSYLQDQYYTKSEYTSPGYFPYVPNINDKANIKVSAMELELRVYLKHRWSLPAPNGFFHHVNFRYGQMNVTNGSYFQELVDPSTPSSNTLELGFNDNLVKYDYKYIDFITVEFGFGYQKVINEWINVGGKMGLNYTSLQLDNSGLTKKVVSGVAKRFGNNLTTITSGSGNSPTKSNVGLSLEIQLGILIY